MKPARLIVHCLVANDERFIWYALNSVLPFVEKIMVWDTGSIDRTVSVVKSIPSEKIELAEKGVVNAAGHTQMRDQMLAATDKGKYDWLLILDGDEIWPEKMFRLMVDEAVKNKPLAVVVKTINFVGDIFHRTPDSAGLYRIGGKTGHYNLRLIDLKTPDLKVAGPHGQQTYFTGQTALQDLTGNELLILDNVYYFHATHLERSSSDQKTLKRPFKRKYELGVRILQEELPKILFETNRPSIVVDVSSKAPPSFLFVAALLTLPRRLKRIILPPKKGY